MGADMPAFHVHTARAVKVYIAAVQFDVIGAMA